MKPQTYRLRGSVGTSPASTRQSHRTCEARLTEETGGGDDHFPPKATSIVTIDGLPGPSKPASHVRRLSRVQTPLHPSTDFIISPVNLVIILHQRTNAGQRHVPLDERRILDDRRIDLGSALADENRMRGPKAHQEPIVPAASLQIGTALFQIRGEQAVDALYGFPVRLAEAIGLVDLDGHDLPQRLRANRLAQVRCQDTAVLDDESGNDIQSSIPESRMQAH